MRDHNPAGVRSLTPSRLGTRSLSPMIVSPRSPLLESRSNSPADRQNININITNPASPAKTVPERKGKNQTNQIEVK